MSISEFKSIKSIFKNFNALPFEDREQLPSSSGIYFVTRLKKEILYIGKTNNFYTRWLSHHKTSSIESLYKKNELLIVYCSIPEKAISLTEAKLINRFKPPLNEILFLKHESEQSENWFSSEKSSISDIPRELRLWVHKKCHCACTICGNLVDDKRIGVTKYFDEKITPENLALVCRKCQSRMRDSSNLEEFKSYRKKLLLRDLDKAKQDIMFYYNQECEEVEGVKRFIIESNIILAYEKN